MSSRQRPRSLRPLVRNREWMFGIGQLAGCGWGTRRRERKSGIHEMRGARRGGDRRQIEPPSWQRESIARMEGRPPGDNAAGFKRSSVKEKGVARILALHQDSEGHRRGDGLVVERGGTEAVVADGFGNRTVELVVG